jgi:hypothetical protein
MGVVSMKDVMKNPAWRAAYLAQAPKPDAPEPRRPVVRNAMNGLELAYAKHLDLLKLAGEVRWWAFNAVRLRIAMGEKAAWYRPDFFIEFVDGRFQFHECKGYEREAAMLRLKVAAGLVPIPFVLVKKQGDGWSYESFGGSR